MKFRTILFALVLGVAGASYAQDTLTMERHYKQGDVDNYTMTLNMNSSMGAMKISADIAQTVKKVYDNGDADVETATTNMAIDMAGRTMNPPASPPTTLKMNKFGAPAGKMNTKGFNPSQLANFLGEKPFKVGDTVPIDQVDKDNPKNHVKGTVKLVSIVNGQAQLETHMDFWTADAESDKPMHADGNIWVDTASHKMLKMVATMKDLPMGKGGGMTISSAEITMVRK